MVRFARLAAERCVGQMEITCARVERATQADVAKEFQGRLTKFSLERQCKRQEAGKPDIAKEETAMERLLKRLETLENAFRQLHR